ncbi:PhoX family protein [Denitrobaculum tricleocarpae]|uniref:PhoX family phosphatase n=1 Tax=Denitrobaculum tricleocarpae TaxID=2591009 RepID=A0A545TKM0_9PROT|nr:PhoX family phosphatase [Denitrobaculum tricleocarpae]TQV77736.1 PhoX family phosphatase [Denitrobaculum tricleocarpae]
MKRKDTQGLTRAEAFELSEDIPSNPSTAPTIGDVIASRFGRRDILKGALAVTAISAVSSLMAGTSKQALASKASFSFPEIKHGVDETHHVAEGYDADVLIRWGDPIFADAPEFDPMKQSAAAQLKQFGYNNDYVGFVGLPYGSDNPDHGLLCVNHEYTSEEVMFPGLGRQDKDAEFAGMTRELIDIEMAAHGGSVIEIKKGTDGKWGLVKDSRYNRRITASTTEMTVSGPAAGHARLKTTADSSGTKVIGTINNCAGGMTPWGTYLMAEENFHGYFNGAVAEGHKEAANHERYGVPGGWYVWGSYEDRFDVSKEPNEPNRFGWVVEVDPFDASSTPVKRTALGRFKHEGAEPIVNKDGRVVVYCGDDQRFDYLYKFVSAGTFNAEDRAANMNLLDEGTLYVAKFEEGGMNWLALTHGEGPLTAANGFADQGDVLIETRRAADLLGATPMDRPEDVEPNAKTNKVYVMCTNNSKRKEEQVNVANPRPANTFGHIIELSPPDGDHASESYAWDILVKCGDPSVAEVGAQWNPATSENGWFGSPDNCAVDHMGRLWISTDQGSNWSKSGTADGIWAMETEGELRGTGKMFFRVPVGAEMCGPRFAPDDKSLFLAVQHPATDGTKDYPGFEKNSTFEEPATRWPDFKEGVPPRPSVVVVTKQDGGVIGV